MSMLRAIPFQRVLLISMSLIAFGFVCYHYTIASHWTSSSVSFDPTDSNSVLQFLKSAGVSFPGLVESTTELCPKNCSTSKSEVGDREHVQNSTQSSECTNVRPTNGTVPENIVVKVVEANKTISLTKFETDKKHQTMNTVDCPQHSHLHYGVRNWFSNPHELCDLRYSRSKAPKSEAQRRMEAPQSRALCFNREWCYVENVGFDTEISAPVLECKLRQDKEHTEYIMRLSRYMYNTGLISTFKSSKVIDRTKMQRFKINHLPVFANRKKVPVGIRGGVCIDDSPGASVQRLDSKFVYLVQRDSWNTFHTYATMYSLYLTAVALEEGSANHLMTDGVNSTERTIVGEPPLVHRHVQDVQDTADILFLDTLGHRSPYEPLWELVLKRDEKAPPSRLHYIQHLPYKNVSVVCVKNGVMAIPGGASPLWKGDWKPFGCRDSHLLQGFVYRVLDGLNLADHRPSGSKVAITIISRPKGRRQLSNEAHIISQLQKDTSLTVRAQDLAAIPIAEQVKMMRETDILIGVHGAGLSNLLFLPPEAVVIEIFPPGVRKGVFRNLCKLMNFVYLSAGSIGKATKGNEWADRPVSVDLKAILNTVDSATRVAAHFRDRFGMDS